MALNVFDVIELGSDPSSPPMPGPMCAVRDAVPELKRRGLLLATCGLVVRRDGSLALSAVAHATDQTLLIGRIAGERATVGPDVSRRRCGRSAAAGASSALKEHEIVFNAPQHLHLRQERLQRHPNTCAARAGH